MNYGPEFERASTRYLRRNRLEHTKIKRRKFWRMLALWLGILLFLAALSFFNL